MRNTGGEHRQLEGAQAQVIRRRGSAALLLLALGACTSRETPAPPVAASASPAPARDAGAPRDARGDGPTSAEAASTLAADVAARADESRARYGVSARIRTVGDAFVLVEVGPPSPLFDKAQALLERALPPLFDGRFTKRPDRGVTVLFFGSGAAYAAYYGDHFGDAGVAWGVYQHGPRELAVDLSQGEAFLPTLTHEIVHPLMQSDFPDAPMWLNEGMASLFEAPVFGPDGGIHGAARNWRQADLSTALASPTERGLVRLDALFGMSPRAFKGDPKANGSARGARLEGLHYALARSVCAWLDGQGKLWPFYRAWRDGWAEDETGEKAFARVMGGTPTEMNGKWLGWAR